jgi:hypothetical protein
MIYIYTLIWAHSPYLYENISTTQKKLKYAYG